MTKVYACLVGNWTCLSDDPSCTMGSNHVSPNMWYEENAVIFSPVEKYKDLEHSYYGMDYVYISYKGKDYRINPIFIQIVEE